MKNIHLILTDKPSRLIIYSTLLNEFRLLNEPYEDWKHKRHIYIINDEKIKEGDWCYDRVSNPEDEKDIKDFIYQNKKHNMNTSTEKKIILTTDQDLIKDGVQAIDDDFLEWFVKNPSCEEVEIKPLLSNNGRALFGYKIIIPKEERERGITITHVGKQESFEEAADRIYPMFKGETCIANNKKMLRRAAFKEGAKWKEEEMLEIMDAFTEDVMGGCNLRAKEWLEQFKNK